MGKSHKKGASRASNVKTKGKNGPVEWTPKMTMNMSDLSRDDDFLNHLLVEKLGTGSIPLYVHKMDPMRSLPKTDPKDLVAIVQRLIVAKVAAHKAIKQAVDELLKLHAVLTFIKKFPQVEIDAFATHASRYFELYLPSGSIEIAHTSRYTHRTGKSELCILATRFMAPGTVITELKGSMAQLTREDEKELKRNSDIRRDFSVIHSGQMKKNHLFLGPARFVNHDCDNNCELFREGKYITFRVLRPIAIGEEITAHYGDGYFGRKNRHCLCATCEKNGRGGYAAQQLDDDLVPDSESDSDSDSDTSSGDSDDESDGAEFVPLNINERRTRRGVYHIAHEDSDNSETEEKDKETKAGNMGVTKQEEKDMSSSLSSFLSAEIPSDQSPVRTRTSLGVGMMTPDTDTAASPSSHALASATIDTDELPRKNTPTTPFKSIIATRRQKAAAAESSTPTPTTVTKTVKVKSQLVTPPPSVETSSLPDEISAQVIEKRLTRSASSAKLNDSADTKATSSKRKGKAKETNREDDKEETEEPEVTRVLRTRPSVHANLCVVGSPVKPEIPRDERGRPLPTCTTCFNILPIIHVDQEVVWGVGKKKEMLECPRCMRHFAIYNQPWPARTPGQRARFMPTPREELTPVDPSHRRITPKVLPALDRKLAAAAKSPSKSRRSESSADEPPAKKRKTETGSKVTMSAKAKETLAGSGRTRSGRHSVPSTKAQESNAKKPIGRPRSKTPPPRASTAVSNPTPKTESISAPVEPRRYFQRGKCPPPSRSTKSTVVAYQPRDGQGRFGTKASTNGKYMRKRLAKKSAMSRAQRAQERDKLRSRLEGETVESDEGSEQDEGSDHDEEDEIEAPLRSINGRERKRRKDISFDIRESPMKRARHDHDKGLDSVSASHKTSQLSVKRIGSLGYHRPNPMNLARSSWVLQANHDPDTASDSETESLGVPQADATRSLTIDSDPLETNNWRKSFGRGPNATDAEENIMSPVGALTVKPTPGNYAKRRWSSEFWASNATRDSSPEGNERSDAEDTSPGYSDDGNSIDINVDYKKRYSVYFITQRDDADTDDSFSGEEDALIPEVADKYALQRRASFDSDAVYRYGRAADNVDDSKRVVPSDKQEQTLPKGLLQIARQVYSIDTLDTLAQHISQQL